VYLENNEKFVRFLLSYLEVRTDKLAVRRAHAHTRRIPERKKILSNIKTQREILETEGINVIEP
jgi:hypothetical protein